MGRSKDAENNLAKIWYIHHNMEPKEIAEKLNVRYNTVLEWIKKGNWEAIREAQASTPEQLILDLKELQQQLTRRRLELGSDQTDDESVLRERVALVDQISKISKSIDTAKKEGELTLADRVRVINELTGDMMTEEPELFTKIMDYLEQWIVGKAGAI